MKVIGGMLVGQLVVLWAGAGVVTASDQSDQTGTSEQKAGFVEVEGGKLYYETAGSGPVLVLIHDGLLHREVWDAQFHAFAKRYRVIRYDRRGYGRSPAPTAEYSDLDDLHALLQALSIKRAVLVGSSSGGRLAIDYALAHPQIVDALVLAGAVVNGMGYSSHFMQRENGNAGADVDERIMRWMEDPYEIAPENAAARERARELLKANPQNVSLEGHHLKKRPEQGALERLGEIAAPTLIVVGEKDIPDVHAHAGAIEAGIVGADREIVPGAGHLVCLERPEAFNRLVLEFLALIERRLTAGPGEQAASFESGFAKVDGAALYYEVMGEGPALVMIHGGLLDHRMWDDQFEEFAKRYRVIRYDVRGHGLSKGVPGAYRDDRDLAGLLKHLGVERTHVMGLSNGGRIAIDFALEYPEMTRSVVAVGPGLSGYQFTGEGFAEDAAAMGSAIQRGELDTAVEHFQRSWTDGRRKTEQVNAGVRERVRRMARWGIEPGRNLSQVYWPDPPAIGRLNQIKAPTLCVVGEYDMPDIMIIVDQIVTQVPGAKKVVISEAAHMVNMEQPDEFNRTVSAFLEECQSRATVR